MFILYTRSTFAMKVTQIYVIAANSIFVMLTILNLLFCILQKLYACNMLFFRHFIYSFLIRRHRFIDSWIRFDALLRVIYLIANIFLNIFFVFSLSEVANRTSHLSFINMISLFFDSHFSFFADVVEIFLHIYQSLHDVFVAMTVVFEITHVIFDALHKSIYFRFAKRSQVAELIVSSNQWFSKAY